MSRECHHGDVAIEGGGGIVRYTVELARALHRRDDVELHLVTSPQAAGPLGELTGAGDRVVAVPAVLMVTNIRFRSFRSLVSPKSGRPYGLVAAAVLLVVGLALWPVVTGCVLAYGYLLAPVLVPLLSPLERLVPARLKEVLS